MIVNTRVNADTCNYVGTIRIYLYTYTYTDNDYPKKYTKKDNSYV